MVKQFLKIAGVKTQAEFYKKYPSEEAFFKAHPEAKNLVNQKMAYGGMYAYNRGGSYPAYQVGATVPPLMEQFDNDPAVYQEALYNYMLSQQQPAAGPQAGVVPPGAPPVGTVSTPLPTEMLYNMANDYQEPASSGYQGVSIVDMLASKGKSDFATRKEIAKALGIKGYTGSASQNKQMINLLNQNPEVLDQIAVAPKTTRSTKKTEQQQQVETTPSPVEESISFKAEYPEAFRASSNQANNDFNMLLPAAATVGTGALGYGIYKAMKGSPSSAIITPFTPRAELASREMINAFKTKENVKAGTQILNDIKASGKYTTSQLRELNKLGFKSENMQKLISEFPKAVEAAKTAAEAKKALGLGSRIAKGARAFQNLKYIKPVSDFARGLFKEDGGENDYSGTYSGGVYYQQGGAYIPEYGDNAYGVLPKYGMGAIGVPPAMYGMGMRDGGQNDLQNLIDAGYNLDYLRQGGPTYSKVTAYNHQGYVPAFDWMAEGGPTFSKHTGYPHQQYVPALDWLQEGGAPMLPAPPQAGPQQAPPQQGQEQGPDPQQIMQAVSQMIQQGTEPGQILQELVKAGIPQEMAQQIIQQVMQQMQGAQPQQAGPMMRSGGLVKGSVHDVSEHDVQDLINKGYKIQYL